MRLLINLAALFCAVLFVLSIWHGSLYIAMGIMVIAILIKKLMDRHGLSYSDQTQAFADRMKKHAQKSS